jgi:hypothetical protein
VTVRSEVVALLDPVFGGRVASDVSPAGGLARPYARVRDEVSEAPRMRGDGRTKAWARLVQVDVYEDLATADGSKVDQAVSALEGVALAAAMRVYVQSRVRLPTPEAGVVHTALTCSVVRPST